MAKQSTYQLPFMIAGHTFRAYTSQARNAFAISLQTFDLGSLTSKSDVLHYAFFSGTMKSSPLGSL